MTGLDTRRRTHVEKGLDERYGDVVLLSPLFDVGLLPPTAAQYPVTSPLDNGPLFFSSRSWSPIVRITTWPTNSEQRPAYWQGSRNADGLTYCLSVDGASVGTLSSTPHCLSIPGRLESDGSGAKSDANTDILSLGIFYRKIRRVRTIGGGKRLRVPQVCPFSMKEKTAQNGVIVGRDSADRWIERQERKLANKRIRRVNGKAAHKQRLIEAAAAKAALQPAMAEKSRLGFIRSQSLRYRATKPERTLLEALNREGYWLKFQAYFYSDTHLFIPDFRLAVGGKKLLIEVDGPSHSTQQAYDVARTAWLKKNRNCIVIRFTNEQVMNHLDDVMVKIADFQPLKIGGKGHTPKKVAL